MPFDRAGEPLSDPLIFFSLLLLSFMPVPFARQSQEKRSSKRGKNRIFGPCAHSLWSLVSSDAISPLSLFTTGCFPKYSFNAHPLSILVAFEQKCGLPTSISPLFRHPECKWAKREGGKKATAEKGFFLSALSHSQGASRRFQKLHTPHTEIHTHRETHAAAIPSHSSHSPLSGNIVLLESDISPGD